MDLVANCSSGKRIAVTAGKVVNHVHCHCGQSVLMPALGELPIRLGLRRDSLS